MQAGPRPVPSSARSRKNGRVSTRQKIQRWLPRAHGAEVALRTALSLGIALCALALFGRLDLASYAMFGSFCAVFGFNEPYRVRARTVGLAGIGILVAISTGILLSAADAPIAAIGAATLIVLAVAVPANVVIGLIPTPPFFHIIALLVCTAIPVPGSGSEILLRIAVAAGATVLSWLISLSGWAVRRAWPGHARASYALARPFFKDLSRTPRVDFSALRDSRVWRSVAENLAGAVLAYALASAFGGSRPYWAVLTVVCVIAPARARPSAGHAIERVIGTAVGLVVVWLLEPLQLGAPVVIAIIVVCQFFTQLFVVRAYAAGLVFITVMVFASLSFVIPLDGPILIERFIETVIGSAAGLLVMLPGWILDRRAARRPSA